MTGQDTLPAAAQFVVPDRSLRGIAALPGHPYCGHIGKLCSLTEPLPRGFPPMQMLCKVSTVFSDVRCPVCGQGFLVYWTRQRAGEREEQRHTLQQTLREQHGATDSAEAHAPAFQVADTPFPAPQRRPQPVPAATSNVPVYN